MVRPGNEPPASAKDLAGKQFNSAYVDFVWGRDVKSSTKIAMTDI